MFKEIRAKFDVVGLTEKGNEYHYHFIIERHHSGAFAYGDQSCHTLKLCETNGKVLREDYYDTRYEHISTYKPSWVKVWRNFIKRNWLNVQSIQLINYEEKESE